MRNIVMMYDVFSLEIIQILNFKKYLLIKFNCKNRIEKQYLNQKFNDINFLPSETKDKI